MRDQRHINWLKSLIAKYTANIERYEALAESPDTPRQKIGAYRANAVKARNSLEAIEENLKLYLENNPE